MRLVRSEIRGGLSPGFALEGLRSSGMARALNPDYELPRAIYSLTIVPDPPSSAGKSFSFGKPSRIGSTVSA